MQVLLLVLTVRSRATPSARVTIKLSDDWETKGSILRDASIPSDSEMFANEEELLASITTSGGNIGSVCAISMSSLAQTYETDWMCDEDLPKLGESIEGNLWGDPPLELRGSVRTWVEGFSAKHDSGNVKVWGNNDPNDET